MILQRPQVSYRFANNVRNKMDKQPSYLTCESKPFNKTTAPSRFLCERAFGWRTDVGNLFAIKTLQFYQP